MTTERDRALKFLILSEKASYLMNNDDVSPKSRAFFKSVRSQMWDKLWLSTRQATAINNGFNYTCEIEDAENKIRKYVKQKYKETLGHD